MKHACIALQLISIFSYTVTQTTEDCFPVTNWYHSISDILPFKRVFNATLATVANKKLLTEDVCEVTDEEWDTLKIQLVQYAVQSKGVNYNTGTFNYTLIDLASEERLENFIASQCEEEYDIQPDMDTKIAYVLKGYLRREGFCPGMKSIEEACKE